jgi:hypothetical protein
MKSRIWNMSVRKFDALFGRKKPQTKSEIARKFAKDNGLPVIDIKLSKPEPGDMVGLPIPSRDVEIDDQILMEIQAGVVVTAFVDSIADGIVYGTGDDGEPYCAPLANCDKIPV